MPRFTKPEEIQVGVIGYGGAFNMGRAHLEQMQAAGMTPVAVVELNEERLKVAAEEFPGIETYTTVDDMLVRSDVNLITIITPHNTHAALAIKCLQAGKHVCAEKPLAITTDECRQMAAEASKQDLVLTTYHNRHWDGGILKARRQIVDEGIIGDLVRVEAKMGGYRQPGDWWRSSKSISGGILYDWGVHLTEYALQIIDDEMTEVFGADHSGFWSQQCTWGDDTNEDEAMAIVRFRRGVVYELRVSSLESQPPPYVMKFTGTKGCYEFSPHGNVRITLQRDGDTFVHEGKEPGNEGWRYYQNLADHLVHGEELIISADWSTRPIHILDLAGRSARQGRTLPVELP